MNPSSFVVVEHSVLGDFCFVDAPMPLLKQREVGRNPLYPIRLFAPKKKSV